MNRSTRRVQRRSFVDPKYSVSLLPNGLPPSLCTASLVANTLYQSASRVVLAIVDGFAGAKGAFATPSNSTARDGLAASAAMIPGTYVEYQFVATVGGIAIGDPGMTPG